MNRYNLRMLELLKVRQQQERNRMPKIQRSEGKTRMAMFKKSLRINSSGSASEDRERIKQVSGAHLLFLLTPLSLQMFFFLKSVCVYSFPGRRRRGRRPSVCTSNRNTIHR